MGREVHPCEVSQLPHHVSVLLSLFPLITSPPSSLFVGPPRPFVDSAEEGCTFNIYFASYIWFDATCSQFKKQVY